MEVGAMSNEPDEIIESLLFWIAQGKFSSLPMAAIVDMQAAKKRAQEWLDRKTDD
jgi:hypothetical protein